MKNYKIKTSFVSPEGPKPSILYENYMKKNEMKKIKTSFVSREGPKARADKTGINFMIFSLIFVENCL